MQLKGGIIFLTFLLAAMISDYDCNAQYGSNLQVDEGTVVKSVKRQYLSYYRNLDKIDGWRILVFSTSNRRELDKLLRKFKRLFPGISHDWVYESPYYRLRVGAYLTRLEARHALKRYKQEFSTAIEVQEKIPKEDFLN